MKELAILSGFLLCSLFSATHVFAQDVDLRFPTTSQFYHLQVLSLWDFVSVGATLGFVIAGILAFFYLLIGGVQWISAGGDKDAVEKSRRRIVQAVIGLIIIFSVYVIFSVIEYVFGINLLYGDLPTL